MNNTTDKMEQILIKIDTNQDKLSYIINLIEKQQEHLSEEVDDLLENEIKNIK